MRSVIGAFPEAAVPLVEVSNDRERLEVNEEAAALLSKLDCAVCPVAVVGLYRSGKSSLLNFLNGRQRGFAVGPSVSRCTRGVWVYGRPLIQRLGDGSECAVVLLDTEGIGGLEADAQYDTRIFALSALLAGSLVYNSVGSIDETAIAQLSFVAQLSKHVRFKAPPASGGSARPELGPRRSSSVEMEAEEDAARLSAYMPTFTWVVRDFALELVDASGETLTADEYLELSLKPQKGYEAAVLERNRLRHMLTSFFPNRSCHTLVRPVSDERKLQRIDELEVGALRPEFVAGVENLRDALFAPETLKPKTICAGGAPIRGAAYVELVRQYVDAINSGGVPVISSAWDHVSRVECRHAAEDALALYLDHLAAHRHQVNTQHAPVEADALDLAASRAARLALEAFDRRAVGDFGHEARADLETKLHAKTADLLKANLRASDRFCEDLANKLYVDVVWADLSALSNAGESPADLAAGLAASWAELRRRYAARAKGPAKDAALLRFSAEKWPESTHELVRRIEARHDHEAQQEHDRLVKLKGELAEVEGSKEARAKILDDAQQSLVQTQMEKARAEARNAAVAKQLDQAREKERQTRAHLEAKLGDLELEIQRLHNQLAQQQASASRLDDRDAGTADVVGGKGGCKCSVS